MQLAGHVTHWAWTYSKKNASLSEPGSYAHSSVAVMWETRLKK